MRIVCGLMLLLCVGTVWGAPAAEPVLSPTAKEREAQVSKLIEQLGDPQFSVRDRAQRQLAQLGLEAFEALTEAKNHDDIEIATQARFLIRQIRFDWVRESDPEVLKDLLKDYEGSSAEMRSSKIKQIALFSDQPPLALYCVEWLSRLARFEESELLSKEAALRVMNQSVPTDKEAAKAHFAAIAKTVEAGRRPAVLWLKAYVLEQTDADAAVKQWESLIAAEERLLDRATDSSPQLVSTLLRRQVGLLDRLKRPEESLQVIARLVQLERGEAASLSGLISWLTERKAWHVLDDVSKRFAEIIEEDAALLYGMAKARRVQGDSSLANQLADKAFAKNTERVGQDLFDHVMMVADLQSRGLRDWSDREYRMMFKKLPDDNRAAIIARSALSEDLHDRMLEGDAAEVLEPLVDAINRGDGKVRQAIENANRSPESIKSRMLYFKANAAKLKNDQKAYAELLDQAIKSDPTDADVLIALFHLPNQDEEQRKQVKELISKAVDQSRSIIEEIPEDPMAYNQLAWLVGNTEGDFDEAIALSQKSIELKRASDASAVGGYLDTLAHCYFGKGDYEMAVKTQLEAAKLEPHSHAIARQLKVFQDALAKKTAK
jgi:tetratricopeptide (TPR) repeat protein